MKASIPLHCLVAMHFLMVPFIKANAQDLVIQKDGQRREGEILGVKANAVRIKIGPAETAVPIASIASVSKAEPTEFQSANELWRTGNAAGALAKLEPLVQTFSGLPTPWAERSCSLLPELYLAQGRTADAEIAFQNFQKLYPSSTSSSDILLARLAISKKDLVTARAKLAPILATIKETKLPAGSNAPAMSQALCLMGEIQESAGEKSEALADYLLVATIFKNDPTSLAKSLARADALEKEKVVVP